MTGAAPRVALLLSGLPRQWRRCLPSQMDLLRGYPHDVFFHFWDTIDEKEKAGIVDFLKPKAYFFEAQQDFSALDTDPSLTPDLLNAPSRIASQHYSWRAVRKLAEPFRHNYDAGIRSRADLQFVYSLDHILPRLKPNDLVMQWWQQGSTFSDIFAVGGIDPILYYHTVYDHHRAYAATLEFNAEILLTTHLKQRPDINLSIEPSRLFFIRRPHMDNYTIEQAMNENPGRNKWLDPDVVQDYADYHRRKKGEEGTVYFNSVRQAQLLAMREGTRQKKDGA